jgi:hypothetical protein
MKIRSCVEQSTKLMITSIGRIVIALLEGKEKHGLVEGLIELYDATAVG